MIVRLGDKMPAPNGDWPLKEVDKYTFRMPFDSLKLIFKDQRLTQIAFVHEGAMLYVWPMEMPLIIPNHELTLDLTKIYGHIFLTLS